MLVREYFTDAQNFPIYFQPDSPLSSGTLLQSEDKKYHDDEDNCSVASSYPLHLNNLMVLTQNSYPKYFTVFIRILIRNIGTLQT